MRPRLLRLASLDSRAAANAPSDLSAGAFKDANSAAGYNSFWTDPGIGLATVRGEARSSYITIPENGRIPFIDRAKSLAELPIREGVEYRSGKGAYEGPEDLPLRERCLIAQSDGGGPVMLNGLYNNNYGFRLTADHLVIEVEMVHDARIIPIYATAEKARASHKPAVIMPWLGDSVAWWEGDTLVAETRNVHPVQAIRTSTPLSPQGTVTERFTRIGADELAVPVPRRGPGALHLGMVGRVFVQADQGRDLRIRLPRGQPLDGRHPRRRASERRESGESGQGEPLVAEDQAAG